MDAWPMIEDAMQHQVAPPEHPWMGFAPPDAPYVGAGEKLEVADHGVEGHADEARASEDRRDDGSTPVHVDDVAF